MKKICVGVLFGGESAEHEVSILTAKSVFQAIDRERFDIQPIGIDKTGEWHFFELEPFLLSLERYSPQEIPSQDLAFPLRWGDPSRKIFSPKKLAEVVDVLFPLLHGPLGEDGTIQAMARLAHLPCVGSGVLSSAVAMDKDFANRLLQHVHLPIADFFTLKRGQKISYQQTIDRLGTPFFIKPANMGSSYGMTQVKEEKEFYSALEHAFLFDQKVLLEEKISGREFECAVLGNDQPLVSLPGELFPGGGCYTHEEKYSPSSQTTFEIPAQIPQDLIQKIQEYSLRAYETLECQGMARIDFFYSNEGNLYINELNTIPGFTPISLYPKLWQLSGISYQELITKLIEYALEEAEKRPNFLLAAEPYLEVFRKSSNQLQEF